MKKSLTLEQMDVLVKMGVPTEKANRGYERRLLPKSGTEEILVHPHPGHPDYEWSEWKPIKFYRKWGNNDRVQSRPSFNIENMLELLPRTVDVNFTLLMTRERDGSWRARYHTTLYAEAGELLDALYNLYILCHKQNKLGNEKR